MSLPSLCKPMPMIHSHTDTDWTPFTLIVHVFGLWGEPESLDRAIYQAQHIIIIKTTSNTIGVLINLITNVSVVLHFVWSSASNNGLDMVKSEPSNLIPVVVSTNTSLKTSRRVSIVRWRFWSVPTTIHRPTYGAPPAWWAERLHTCVSQNTKQHFHKRFHPCIAISKSATGHLVFCPLLFALGFWAGHRGLSLRPPVWSHILQGRRFVLFFTSVSSMMTHKCANRITQYLYPARSDHIAHIIELLGPLPSRFALSGRNSKRYFNSKGKI